MKSTTFALFAFLLTACGGDPAPAPSAPEAPPEAAPAAPAVEAAPAAEAAPEGEKKPQVFFVSPADGAEVTSPVKLEFGIKGMSVDAAGEVKEGSGHHHLIINGGPIEEGVVVPANETHIHYGQAQTEAEVALEPGEYSLTMQFANGAHQSYGDPMSAKISIKVVAPE